MEDVLEVYQRPYDGNEVLVCMDETSKQQVKETRVPRPAAPGLSAAYDYEYERNGVSSLFMLFAPLDGWRRVEVRERRTKVDWAHVIKKLVDENYPDRDRIVLVMDNLNTHKLSSLYEAFEPAEARLIAERLEIHYTPKHGSWLNMAEIEIGVLARQCLDRRIANQDILRGEVNAWQNQRNRDVIRVDWRFTTENARIKLKSLYPSIQKVEPLGILGISATLPRAMGVTQGSPKAGIQGWVFQLGNRRISTTFVSHNGSYAQVSGRGNQRRGVGMGSRLHWNDGRRRRTHTVIPVREVTPRSLDRSG